MLKFTSYARGLPASFLASRPMPCLVSSFHSSCALKDFNKSDAAPSFQEGISQFFKKAEITNLHNPAQHWNTERLLSVTLAPSMLLGIFFDNIILDLVIVAALVPHCHLGMQQVLTDYVHPRKFPVLGRLASVTLLLATTFATLGLLKLAWFDVGVTKAVKILMGL